MIFSRSCSEKVLIFAVYDDTRSESSRIGKPAFAMKPAEVMEELVTAQADYLGCEAGDKDCILLNEGIIRGLCRVLGLDETQWLTREDAE